MKTVMMHFLDELKKDGYDIPLEHYNFMIEKEKEQIMKAYCDGFNELLPFHENEYYNQTYNNESTI